MRRRAFIAGAAGAAGTAALGLTACGDDGGSGEGGGSGDETITWMSMLHTPTTPKADGPVETGLAKYTGQKFKIEWVPDASKEEKINSALSSGALADMVALTLISSTSVRQALTSGMFWEVDKYLADYPNLAKIDKQTLDSSRIDGKLCGVPFQNIKARYGVVVRQDWLDTLGLEVPHTIDELTEVAKAFATGNPVKGKKTTGFYDRQESYAVGFRSLTGYFGAGNFFEVNDAGNVVASCTTDAYKQAMAWYRSVYAAGGVNQDFVTVQKSNQQDGIAQGRGGIVVTGLFEAKNYMALAQNADPKTPMKWALVNDVTYKDVPRRILSDTNGGMGGWLAMPKSEVKTEDDLKRVLTFIDKLMDKKPFELMTNGVEGTHYKMTDGAVEILDEAAWEQQIEPYSSSRPNQNVETFKSKTPYVDEANKLMAENDKYVVTNPAQALSSATYDQQWTTLDQQINDAYNKYITGHAKMSDYESLVKSLAGQGLDKISSEFTESYHKANG